MVAGDHNVRGVDKKRYVRIDDVVRAREALQLARAPILIWRQGPDLDTCKHACKSGLLASIPPDLRYDCGAGYQWDASLLQNTQHRSEVAVALLDRYERTRVENSFHLTSFLPATPKTKLGSSSG
jgi:hypothetical protein